MQASKIKSIYKIKITNWNRHNPNHKKSYKKTMIDNNFCNDAKLNSVPISVRWLYLALLLHAGSIARDELEIGERWAREVLESSYSIDRALSALQSLQLLTFEKILPFRNEMKVNEMKRTDSRVLESPPTSVQRTADRGCLPDLQFNDCIKNMLSEISHTTQKNWIALYPDSSFFKQEFLKIENWLEANPHKRPKSKRGISAFLTSWFSRGWESYRKGLPSLEARSKSISQILAEDER